MSDSLQSSSPATARVFVPADPGTRAVVEAAVIRGVQLVPLARLDAGAETPHVDDVVLLPGWSLPSGTLELAARLRAYAPAVVVLLLPSPEADVDLLGRALRLGVRDVLTLPTTPSELRLRLDLARRRPAPSPRGEDELGPLAHQLTNVLAALRLTAYAVGRLPRPAVAEPSDPVRPLLDSTALAARIEAEVDQAVLLVAELDHRLRPVPGRPEPQDDGAGRTDGLREWV